jgi:hypothetical protein
VLLFAQIHCVAACAADLCSADCGSTESVPPCHKHQSHSQDQNRDSCSFHRIISSVTSVDIQHFDAPVVFVAGAAPAISAVFLPADANVSRSDFSDGSPPGAPGISFPILRI